MDRCPVEIWGQIFALACTDNGFTGRSLSLTSWHIHELSKSVKLQSLSVTTLRQIHGLARVLADTPPKYRRVRYLFIGDDEELGAEWEGSAATMDVWHRREEENRLQEKPVLDAYLHIIRTLAPTLANLVVHFQSYISDLCFHTASSVSFPSLVELTVYGLPISHDDPSTPMTGESLISSRSPSDRPPPFPSLKRLYLAHSYYNPTMYFRLITTVAPSLTHLSLPYQNPITSSLPQALGIQLLSHTQDSGSLDDSSGVVVSTLPSTLKMVLIDMHYLRALSTNAEGRMRRMRDIDKLETIARGDERVFLLRERPSGIKDTERYWLDRMGGGDGIWAVPQPEP